VCGCLAALPALAADPPKNADGGTFAPGDYTGKLVSTPGTDGAFTIAVETDRLAPKPGAAQAENRDVQQLLRDQEHIDKLQAELARSRNLREYERRLAALNEAMARMQADGLRDKLKASGDVKVVKEQKDVDFHAADGVKVRTLNPPVQFDDKGNPKKYTKEELDAFKGKDKDLPGYEATADSLKVGDMVKVTLAPPKFDKNADKDSDAKKDTAKPGNQVTVIVILSEDAGGKGKGK
jgi:hypothetical protein